MMSIQDGIVDTTASTNYDHARSGFSSPNSAAPSDEVRPVSPPASSSGTPPRSNSNPPEKKLTLFAFRLAVLEKAASGLGTLAFILATVVLLGGFAIFIGSTDFWVVTAILVSEAIRIFSRSHELKWRQQVTRTLAEVRFNPTTTHEPEHDRVRNTSWPFLSEIISRWLSGLQTVSALACISLSLYCLIVQGYGEVDREEKHNRAAALNLFYSLALAEAILFLLEKVYWIWEISFCELLNSISDEYDLGEDGVITIRRFFYDAYSKCIDGSIFDGIRMDLVSFVEELLDSTFSYEQLIAVNTLQKLTKNSGFSSDTLRKIGTNMRIMERLVEMLNWKASEEQKIRKAAAEILAEIADKRHRALRLAGIPGAMESISSLLHKGDPNSNYLMFKQGLLILTRLAKDHDNCFKIGNSRGLLSGVIEFTSDAEIVFQNPVMPGQLETIKLSLQLVKMLVNTTGSTGKILRDKISNIVYAISSLRNILDYGASYIELQKLAIEILLGLAMDEKAKEKIASTGGIIRLLFSIFFSPRIQGQSSAAEEAGQAIAMLALESEKNCSLILKKADMKKLIRSLDKSDLCLNASRILRNLCAYSAAECEELKEVAAALPFALKTTMNAEDEKIVEVAIGLTYQICRLAITPNHFITKLWKAEIQQENYAKKLTEILKEYRHPSLKVPRIRRFVIQQATWMMKHHKQFIKLLNRFGMGELLERVGDTTSDLECFHVFSGSAGLNQHREQLLPLVNEALELLSGSSQSA